MPSEWSTPQRPEARVWLVQFNQALAEWLTSGGSDEAAFDGIVQALRSLAEREPEAGTMVAALAATVLHQHAGSAPPGRAAELAGVGLVAERLPANGSPRLRAWLEVEAGQAELAASRPAPAAHAAQRALSAIGEGDAGGPVAALLRARALTLRGAALDALLDAGGALDAYRAAEAISGALAPDDTWLQALLIETLDLLYGGPDGAPEDAIRAELRLLWRELSLTRIAIASGAARTCALAAPDELDGQLESTARVFEQHGLADTSPLLLVPAARHAGREARDALRDAVLSACAQTGTPPEGFAAIFAVAAGCAAQTSEDARTHLQAAEHELAGIGDALVAAAVAGLVFAGATIHDLEPDVARDKFMLHLDALEDLHDPRLDDARLRAAFDEPVALALLALAPEASGPSISPGRVRLARLVDFELGLRSPLDRWLPADGASAGPELAAAATLAADRIGRLGHALGAWPGAAAIVLRAAGSLTVAFCASADGTLVTDVGPEHRDAAADLVDALDSEVEALELTGSAGPEDTLLALGRRAYDTLPDEIRALIARSHTVLICPDHRTGGDVVPYELFHDGSSWLGIEKVVARLPSLRALVRAVEGSARRDTHRRGLTLAVPDPPGHPALLHAVGEAAQARDRLRSMGWDAPDIEKSRITSDFVLDRLPWIRHLHVAAHGESEGVSEELLLADGARLTSVDLASRFLPRSPTAYINACSLATTRWVGGGRSQGIAYAFFETGSPAVVANLLPVEDELASALARAFYEHAHETAVGDALRAAREDVRPRGSPALWGSTILMGDPRATLEERAGDLPLVDRLLDALMLGEGDRDALWMQAVGSLDEMSRDPRLEAAMLLVRGISGLEAEPDASSRATVVAACRVALDLDYLPGAALLAAILASTYGEADERAETLRVLEGVLEVLEPLEHDEGPWKSLLDRTLTQWMLARLGDRAPGLQVRGPGSDAEHEELLGLGQAMRDMQLAIEARRIRSGPSATGATAPRSEHDLLHEAVTASRSVHLEDMPEVAAYCDQVTEKLIAAGALTREAQPHAATAITGLLHWLWGSQNVFALPPEMADGQTGTLGQLVAAIREHWPPVGAQWFAELAPLPKTIRDELASIEGLPYDDRLYPAIDTAIGRVEDAVTGALGRVRERYPARAPDAMAFALGALIEHNTYSYLDGSVPEGISERLTRVHTRVSADAEAAFYPWLMEGFRGAREHQPDELERWRLG